MTRLFIAVLFLTISNGFSSQVMWQVGQSNSQKWYLAQTDEFNDGKINPDMWNSLSSTRPYNVNLDVYYKADNIQYTKGFISLLAKKENTSAKVEPTAEEAALMAKNGKTLAVNKEYQFAYSGALLTSSVLYRPGYFEMRFKASDQKGVWPSLSLSGGKENESIALFAANGEAPEEIYTGLYCINGCNTTAAMYSKKNFGGFTKLNEPFSKDWNIISAEWGADYIKYFINGTPVAYYKGIVTTGKSLVLSNTVSKKGYGIKNGPVENTQFPAVFDVDYLRVWGKEDTSGKYKDNYALFENANATIDNRLLYSAEVKKKAKAISKAPELKNEIGTITLLPVFYNKYSLSIQGSTLNAIQVEVIDRFGEKVAGFTLSNVQYYVMDLSALPTGPYKVKITVMNQVLEHDIPVINPEKVGEQRDGK
jgi:beta-glucanase (GH16 family)